MLSWEEYVKSGVVRKTSVNKGLIRSLLIIAEQRINTISKLELTENSSSTIFTNHYDSLREICEAVCLINGYKIYNQEAVGLFFREILKEPHIFSKFDRFRVLRNGVNYYGKSIPMEVSKDAVVDMNNLIKNIKSTYLNDLE